ncbi:DUF1566 domain-containing protein [Thalassobellus citreus]|uniref:Lcl C-terminal domain-containing protein n=1 Tax=Thalassobellus citreus TaxID=3367752 RepID=UPI00379733AC
MYLLFTVVISGYSQIGIGTPTPDASSVLELSSTTQGFLPPRMTYSDMTSIVSPAEGLVVYCLDCDPKGLCYYDGTDFLNTVSGLVASELLEIGKFMHGGIVFWIDPTDSSHGLVCAVEDQSSGNRWYNGSYVETGATATAIGTGLANTDTIISVQGALETTYAAGLANAYTGGGFSDWFLPSKDELAEMYDKKTEINAGASLNSGSDFYLGYYWCSTESGTAAAWSQNFSNGNQISGLKGSTYVVRPVRAF